jgi:GNAT superfamily N-acetyltransferase
MSVSIVPFTPEHIDAAAALLATRHRCDRISAPALSAKYEDSAATSLVLQELLATNATNGVVALDAGHVVGYLLGAPDLGSPTHPFAGFMHPRAADMPYAGHAADPDDGASHYPRLYAALAQQWVVNGLVGHYIGVPARPEASEPWWDLGFGRFIALGLRATTPPDEEDVRNAMDVEIRRATPEDEDAVLKAMTEFFRTFADPPIFVPFLPETTAERRRFVADHLADPGCPVWLAFTNERLMALQMFEEPGSPHWHQSPLQTPERSVYLYIAYTVPEARSAGIGAALLHRTMAWAREAGYDSCMAHWVTASRAAPFWRGRDFQPVSYWLHRSIDERAMWADGQR